MAKVIKADGSESEIKPDNKDGTFSLEVLQGTVGGYIEVVRLPGQYMVINEEGKLKGLPLNARATEMALRYDSIFPEDVIVGDVILMSTKEMK